MPAVSYLGQVAIGKKRTGMEIARAEDVGTSENVNREPIAKEVYTWEERRVTRERMIYKKGG